MNAKRLARAAALLLAAALIIAACQGFQPEAVVVGNVVEVTRVITETVVEEGQSIEVTRVVAVEVDVAGTPPATQAAPQSDVPTQRLIIKDGRITVVTQDTDTAVDTATQLIVDVGGYIISQQVYSDPQGYRYANMRLAVPVTQFENGMKALRQLGTVTNESTSGEDVTEEFIDLKSRLDNLGATRDRLRTFLDQAENVEQALEVNEELKKIEEEMAIIQGRINFLRDRAAFSTIDLSIQPWIPTPTPSPTPTATPTATPTPLPTPDNWRPGDTAETARVQLQNTAQDVADFTIYNSIVCGPWLLLFLLLGLPIVRIAWRLRRRQSAPSAGGSND
jgi:hypothetical protein